MGPVVLIIVGLLVLLLIVGVVSYNRFVTQRNLIKDAWANIDTELRRRYDLIPNLVETVRGLRLARARDLRERHEGARDGDGRDRLARRAGRRRGSLGRGAAPADARRRGLSRR